MVPTPELFSTKLEYAAKMLVRNECIWTPAVAVFFFGEGTPKKNQNTSHHTPQRCNIYIYIYIVIPKQIETCPTYF